MAKDSTKAVRTYRVMDSLLEINTQGAIAGDEKNYRTAGQTVTSDEFKPASLEQRYLSNGAIERVLPAEPVEEQVPPPPPPAVSSGEA